MTPFREQSLCYSEPTEQLQKQTARVQNTLCEGIMLQKRFVKELYCRTLCEEE
jgi:hypothetical protein